jgi:hypothetical protein
VVSAVASRSSIIRVAHPQLGLGDFGEGEVNNRYGGNPGSS